MKSSKKISKISKVPLKVLIVFGSKSDDKIFNGIVERIPDYIEFDLHVCSAHRTPEMLYGILENNYDVIIAGAGLAAHLPGVCASKTVAPIIGVPVNNNFLGLDSLLSIIQMPPGIPVLSTGIDNSNAAAEAVKLLSKKYDSVQLVNCDDKLYKKAFPLIEKFEINEVKNSDDGSNHTFDNISDNALIIRFVKLSEKYQHDDSRYGDSKISIFCPTSEDVNISPETLLNITKKGLWVGLNRADNAVIAAAEIIAINDDEMKDKLISYREEMVLKVMKDNEDINNASHR